MKAEQRKQAIAHELVWLPAAVDHCPRGCLQEAIDQEAGIERQARLGQPGRSAHVDEHANDIALLTDIDALAVADEIRADFGGEHWNDRYIGLWAKLTREPDRRGAGSAKARKHERFAAGRPPRRGAVAEHTNAARRSAARTGRPTWKN